MYSYDTVCETEGICSAWGRGIHLREHSDDHSVFFINDQSGKYTDTRTTNHITYVGEQHRVAANQQLVKWVDDYHIGVRNTPRTIRVYAKLTLASCAAVTKEGRLCKNKCHNEFWMCGRHGGSTHPKIDISKQWVCVGDFGLTYYHHCDTAGTLKFSLVEKPIDFSRCLDSDSENEEN